MDFCEELILLVSGGIDHQIYIWNPYIETPVYMLKGHATIILSLKFVPDPWHLVSVDEDSILKVWNIRQFKQVNQLNLNELLFSNFKANHLYYIKEDKSMVVSGKGIF